LPLDPAAALRENDHPMKSSHYYLSVGVAALCLILSITVIVLGNSNQKLQVELQNYQARLQAQQEQINAGNVISQQVGPNLLRDMATVSVDEPPMKELLGKHGYTVNVTTPAPGAAESSTAQ
jgi:hypothetical protein